MPYLNAGRLGPGPWAVHLQCVVLLQELENILKKLSIHNAVWCMGRSRRYYQVLFSVESGEPCEEALKKLAERGIGVMLDSTVRWAWRGGAGTGKTKV